MALFQPNLSPRDRDLRWFAGLWFPAFWGAVGLFLRRHEAPDVASAVWALALVLAVAGLVIPATIRPVYRLMLLVTFPIGWVMSHVILGAAYFLVITPIGYVLRCFHDPMRRKIERGAQSYWVECTPARRDQYFRQM
jgi:hypothetical protein